MHMLLIAMCALAHSRAQHRHTPLHLVRQHRQPCRMTHTKACPASIPHFTVLSLFLLLYLLYFPATILTRLVFHLNHSQSEAFLTNAHTVGLDRNAHIRCKHTHCTLVSIVSTALGITSHPAARKAQKERKRGREWKGLKRGEK